MQSLTEMESAIEANGELGRRKKKSLLPVVIVGAGRLGESLLTLGSFTLSGFTVVGVFDKDPKRIGLRFVTSTCGTHVVEPTIKLASRAHAHMPRAPRDSAFADDRHLLAIAMTSQVDRR